MDKPKPSNPELKTIQVNFEIFDYDLAKEGQEFNVWLKDGKEDYEVIAYKKGSFGGSGKIGWDTATNTLANYMKSGNKVKGKIIAVKGDIIVTEIYVNSKYKESSGCLGSVILFGAISLFLLTSN